MNARAARRALAGSMAFLLAAALTARAAPEKNRLHPMLEVQNFIDEPLE